MAITPDYFTGAEHGVPTINTNGNGLANTVGGSGATPVTQTSIKASGAYAFRHFSTSSGTSYIRKTVWSTGDSIVWGSFKFRIDTNFSGTAAIMAIGLAAGVIAQVRWNSSATAIEAFFSGGSNELGSALSLSTWYRIAWKVDCSQNPNTLDLSIYDDTGSLVETLSASIGQAATNATYYQWGWSTSVTGDLYIDDVIGCSSGDTHPIGDVLIVAIKPSADGTHNAGTNVIEDNTGADIGVTPAYNKINSIPLSATTYIRQAAIGTGNYAEVLFEDFNLAHNVIVGAHAVLAYTSATTTANRGGCIVSKDNFSSSTTVWGAPGATADYSDGSTSNLFYKDTLVNGVVDDTTVDALRARVGFSDDVTPNPYWASLIIEIGYTVSTGLSETVHQSSETDSAGSISRRKIRSIGQASETDTAGLLSKSKARGIGQAAEAETSSSSITRKQRSMLQAPEVDTAHTVIRLITTQTISVAQAGAESNTAQAITVLKIYRITLGQASETDTAQVVTSLKIYRIILDQAAETDSAHSTSILKIYRVPVGQAIETDTAEGISVSTISYIQVGQAIETDSASLLTSRKVFSIGQASEVDEPFSISALHVRILLQALETDEAFAPSSRKIVPVGQALEIDEATFLGTKTAVTLGQAIETDSAQFLQAKKIHHLDRAIEADTAGVLHRTQTVTIATALEFNSAQATTVQYAGRIYQVFEIDSAGNLQAVKVRILGQANELDFANVALPSGVIVLERANEVYLSEYHRPQNSDEHRPHTSAMRSYDTSEERKVDRL